MTAHGIATAALLAAACSSPPGGQLVQQQPSSDPIAWRRVELTAAGISIDQHPDWPVPDDAPLYYQRASSDSEIVVRWGADATIDALLAQLGPGSPAGIRRVDADDATTVDGLPARRVRVTTGEPVAVSHSPTPRMSGGERVLVYVGFRVGSIPVLVGYQGPRSQIDAIAPLTEHIVASVRRL